MLPFAAAAIVLAASACAGVSPSSTLSAAPPPAAPAGFAAACQSDAVQAVAAHLSTRVTIKQVADGPQVAGGAHYVAAANGLPAYCQVSGSFVTNPETGKTSNFLATLPENWNGKYLQMGCSGHCGQFYVSDATVASVTVTNQGKPGDILRSGYASFATDEGHAGLSGGAWAIKADGSIDEDAIVDFLYRSQQVLSHMGKDLTTAFYARATGAARDISRSYFSGCSGGGRDALVAASYFPEQFDGIIAGSPYANMVGKAFQVAGIPLAYIRSPAADVSAPLMARVAPVVMAQCDALDGVHDGVIQNPAACNFRPERDLPRCGRGRAADQCFTPAQIQTVSTYLTAVTDEHGAVVQPGYSVSNLQGASRVATPPVSPTALEPWPHVDNTPGGSGGLWALGDATLHTFVHQNDPNWHTRSIIALRSGGPGAITNFRVVVPRTEVDRATQAMRMGIGAIPENASGLFQHNTKLLIWSNGSDQLLTPNMAVNYYRQLAALHAGYEQLQRNVRLFSLPGTVHCSMGGVGVNSFDALGAIDAWVDHGVAPNALIASQYPSHPDAHIPLITVVDYSAPPARTMPLCAYPAMARYKGQGDVNDGANWSCPAGDQRMLTLGESGRRAGIVPSTGH